MIKTWHIEKAIKEHWGERCDDHNPHCPCCAAWEQFDALIKAEPKGVKNINLKFDDGPTVNLAPVVWPQPNSPEDYAATVRDAERYRFLRTNEFTSVNGKPVTGETFDGLVDQWMQQPVDHSRFMKDADDIGSAVMTWMVEKNLLDAGNEYQASEVIGQLETLIDVGDGRPCAMDKFVADLHEATDDTFERDEAITHWLYGSWDEAMAYLKDEDAGE